MSDTDLIIESEIKESGHGIEMNPYQAIHDFKELTPKVEQPDMPTRQMFEDATTLLNDDENVGVYLGALSDQFMNIAKWVFENPQGLDGSIEGEFLKNIISRMQEGRLTPDRCVEMMKASQCDNFVDSQDLFESVSTDLVVDAGLQGLTNSKWDFSLFPNLESDLGDVLEKSSEIKGYGSSRFLSRIGTALDFRLKQQATKSEHTETLFNEYGIGDKWEDLIALPGVIDFIFNSEEHRQFKNILVTDIRNVTSQTSKRTLPEKVYFASYSAVNRNGVLLG